MGSQMLPMNAPESAALAEAGWVKAFLTHVMAEVPTASKDRLRAAATRLYTQFGEYDPVEVAEAEWTVLPFEA